MTPPPAAGDAHPQANRAAVLGGRTVGYVLVRAARRSIGMAVDAQGLSVRAPRWVSVDDIERVLQDKAGWILRKLDEARARQGQRQALQVIWQDGATLPYLGRALSVRRGRPVIGDPAEPCELRQGRVRVTAHWQAAAGPGLASTLWLDVPSGAGEPQWRALTQAWFLQQARILFPQRLQHFSAPLGVRCTRLTLSNAGTRWGSASRDGSIRLNWRLMHFDPAIIDYVVAHELSHLRVMDHSPLFWRTVESVMPDYAVRRLALRQTPIPDWSPADAA